jgi:metal-sulfur cluster biosynthetic enzyme
MSKYFLFRHYFFTFVVRNKIINMKPTVDYIKKNYNKFNTLFFNGTLPNSRYIKIIFKESKNCLAYMMLNSATQRKLKNIDGKERVVVERVYDEQNNLVKIYSDAKYVICIAEEREVEEPELLSTLIHEMIHIWQFERINFDEYDGNYSWENQHDKVFNIKMNNINILIKEYELNINNVKLVGNDK